MPLTSGALLRGTGLKPALPLRVRASYLCLPLALDLPLPLLLPFFPPAAHRSDRFWGESWGGSDWLHWLVGHNLSPSLFPSLFPPLFFSSSLLPSPSFFSHAPSFPDHPEKREAMKLHLQKLVREGVIYRNHTSPYRSAALLVRKPKWKEGDPLTKKYRLVQDYRALSECFVDNLLTPRPI